MQAIINRLAANKLQDFEGLKIIGSIPVSEQIVNEFATEFIQTFFSKQATPAPTPSPQPAATTDYMSVLKNLEIHNFKVSFEKEKMILNVDVRR